MKGQKKNRLDRQANQEFWKKQGALFVEVDTLNLQGSVDESLRDRTQAIVKDIGIDLASAIRLFLPQLVQENDLPFQKEDDPFYSPLNQAHLRTILDDYKYNRNFASHELIEN